MIYLNTPICKDKNDLGDSINKFVEKLNDDDWVLILDHDVLFTTKHWFNQVISATEQGDAIITCVMNTGGNPPQKINFKSDSLQEHFKKGEELYKEHGNDMDIIEGNFCGTFMLFPKRIWNEVGGYPRGFGLADYKFYNKVSKKYPIKLLKGLYLYHRRITHSKMQ